MKKQILVVLACATMAAGLNARQRNGKMQHGKQQMQGEEKFFEITVDNTRSKKVSYVTLKYNHSLKRMSRKVPAGKRVTFADKGYCLDEIEVKQGRAIFKPEVEKKGMFCGQYTLEVRPDESAEKGFKVYVMEGKPNWFQRMFQ